MSPAPSQRRVFKRVLLLAISAAALAGGNSRASNAQIQHGEYVARAADCMSCHSRPGAQPFSGGAALPTPFGNIYAPNITQDAETGIGRWNKDDFEKVLRLGIRKDGALLYPAMPYVNYTKMTDDDISALWVYMQTIKPVRYTVPENTFRFPFNIRPGLAAWRDVYFSPGRFTPATDKNAAWNRGAYLVEAMGHCDACHTPRNIAQASEQQHELTGAQIQGWYAPDISNDSLSKLAAWNVNELAVFLKTGHSPGNTKSFGPMQEVVHDSLRYLTDGDLHAMAVYLKTGRGGVEPQVATRMQANPAQLSEGKALYEQNCAGCHQTDGKGLKGAVPALAGNTAVTARDSNNVIMATLAGFDAQNAWGAMPAFSKVLTDSQIAAVSNYIRTAWSNDGQPDASEWTVANWRDMAQASPKGQSRGLICPDLPQDVLQPALKQGDAAFKASFDDRAQLEKLVAAYKTARPEASTAEVIEALSTAYCRAAVDDPASQARAEWKIAEFTQRLTLTVFRDEPAAAQNHQQVTH